MSIITPIALALAVVTAPAWAQAPNPAAPPADLARCENLHALFTRYSNTGGESRSGSAFDGIEANKALANCRRGNTQAGIPVLERLLRSQGFKV
ncbi:hypothetical protein [Reyranella sp. CPCC 100927]|uniref:hypothetical protein n=1 Tax=Reyranella sp. CPCC 100927 TaxID=2599616 RepID=UPI0011B720BC|nr:hypothetical protein [Reyranella sp. CPCC 100927]TWT12999.1 hypothetical protein FQU96_12225 [Reyranella sp. CPCC 100927]